MNYNKICVFDFETDGRDPHKVNPVQLAAVIVDPRKLEIIKNAEFNSARAKLIKRQWSQQHHELAVSIRLVHRRDVERLEKETL